MTQPELGFLMLASHLGQPDRQLLTVSQLRRLASAMRNAHGRGEDRPLCQEDLIRCGFDLLLSQRVIELLEDDALLEEYLLEAHRKDCIPLTWVSPLYPGAVRECLRDEAPGCIWAKGNTGLLARPAISVVGSREPDVSNLSFAFEVGRQAAKQGFVLISGNARGSDQAAQAGALEAGGDVISIVADKLCTHPENEHILYLSEDDFDAGFTAARALSRNRLIHSMGKAVFVAQSSLHTGGTWSGTYRNLRSGWRPVYVLDDESAASDALQELGARGCQQSDIPAILKAVAEEHTI